MTRRIFNGIVVQRKSDKTITVRVDRISRHALYKKIIKYSKLYLVHDPSNKSRIGEKISFLERSPLSRRKCWEILIDKKSSD